MFSLICVVALLASCANAKAPRTDITVSGISSGGAMAAQLHLAYSSVVSASGIVAGPPYWCAEGLMALAISECLYGPAALIPVSRLENQLQTYVQAGSADSTSNLHNDPVYIFSGTNDHTVVQDVVKINEQMFTTYGAKIQTNYGSPANHAFVTDKFGGLCEMLNMDNFINNCSFDLAYAILDHAFGNNLTKPSATKPTPLHGQFVTIEQPALIKPEAVDTNELQTSDVFSYWADLLKTATNENKQLEKLPGSVIDASFLNASGFDKEGYVYYPSGCAKGKKCPIHIALHGCLQGKARIGDVFAKNAGYLEVAELNHIIILFPQIVATYVLPTNPEGCWDWWGYGGLNYANKQGVQMAGVIQMAQSLKAINLASAE